MKKIIASILVLVLLLAAGCAKQKVIEAEEAAPEEPAKEVPAAPVKKTAAEPKETAPVLSSDKKEEIEEYLLSNRVYLAPNVLKTKPGQTASAWYAVTNQKVIPSTFRADIVFKEARDTSFSLISCDEEIMQSWFSETELVGNVYDLEKKENLIVPIIVKPTAEIKEEAETVPGTYVFYVRTYYNVDGIVKDDYDLSKEISIRIVE